MSWNTKFWFKISIPLSLPLREVVSWNDYELRRIQRGRTSTSAWGSELKWLTWYLLACVSPPSTSAWGSELKYVFENKTDSTWRLPLREVVSWNISGRSLESRLYRLPLREVVSWNIAIYFLSKCDQLSTSAWGSELKFCLPELFSGFLLSTSAWGSELK